MEPQQQAQVPTIGAAPPTMPGTLGPRRTTWPSVLGVITIVLGSLGILSGLWTAVSPLFADLFVGLVPGGQSGMESVASYAWLMVALGVMTMGRAGLEIMAGVAVYRRRGGARRLVFAWAWVAIVLSFVGAIATYLMQMEQFRVMSEKGMPMPAGLSGVIGVFSAVIAVAWGCLFPVFALVWFSRRVIREEVRAWAAGAGA